MALSSIPVRNGTFHVRLWSSGQGKPALFLHGYDGHPGEAGFLTALAKSRQVFAPEHPGYGESTGVEEIDDIFDMTLYYRELIEQLGVGPVDVVGHSLGGMFAAELAVLAPQLVRRVVLIAPFGLWLDETQIPDLFVMSANQLNRATWHEADSHAAQQALSRLTDGQSGNTAIVTRAMNLSTAGKFLWPIPDRGLGKRLHLIKAPTLIVMGASDSLIPPAYGAAFRQRIAGSKVELIANAGHNPQDEQPEALLKVVEAFLA